MEMAFGNTKRVCSLELMEDMKSLQQCEVGVLHDQHGEPLVIVRPAPTRFEILDAIDSDAPVFNLLLDAAENHLVGRRQGLDGEDLLQWDCDFYSGKGLSYSRLHAQYYAAGTFEHEYLEKATKKLCSEMRGKDPSIRSSLELLPTREMELQYPLDEHYEKLAALLTPAEMVAAIPMSMGKPI